MNICGKAAFAATMVLGLSGCATVMNGTHQKYAVSSEPEGATVKFTDGQHCKTPCKLKLKRKNDLRADFSLADYKPTYVLVRSKLGGTTFGNILLGGIVGGVVDGSNGASNKLTPEPLNVRLTREGSGDEPVLLDKDGKVDKTVQAYNDSVRVDVAKTIGPKLAGIEGDQAIPAGTSDGKSEGGSGGSATGASAN